MCFLGTMVRGARIVLVLLVALAGCGSQPSHQAQPGPGLVAANDTGPPLPDADINASLGALGVEPDMPGAEPAPRFVGRWAAEEDLCAGTAWRFTADELRTPAGSVCRFLDVRDVAGGYDIAARCTAEGPEQEDLLTVRFAESARGLMFESDVVADAGLVRCGAE